MAGPGGTGDIQAVQRAAQILALFTVRRPQLTVAEAASLVGLNRTTVARYFGSMMTAGIIERARDEPAAYVPGRLLLRLGAVAQGQRQVLGIAPSFMRQLSREASLTVVLSLQGPTGPVVHLVTEVDNFPILITVRVGTVLDMDSGQGHLFLCYSTDTDMIASYWKSLSTEDRERVERAVAEIPARGLAVAHSSALDIAVLAAPVFDEHEIVATVALVGTLGTLRTDSVAKQRALLRAAYQITEELGGADIWRSSIEERPEDGGFLG